MIASGFLIKENTARLTCDVRCESRAQAVVLLKQRVRHWIETQDDEMNVEECDVLEDASGRIHMVRHSRSL